MQYLPRLYDYTAVHSLADSRKNAAPGGVDEGVVARQQQVNEINTSRLSTEYIDEELHLPAYSHRNLAFVLFFWT